MGVKSFRWVQDRLREIVQQNPNQTSNCVYFDDAGQPSCVVGHVLHELGVEPEIEPDFTFRPVAFEGKGADSLPWVNLGVRKPGSRQGQWISVLQETQDSGATWGEALACADEARDA